VGVRLAKGSRGIRDLEAQRAGGGNCVMHNTVCS
jgi:hypothetical protein